MPKRNNQNKITQTHHFPHDSVVMREGLSEGEEYDGAACVGGERTLQEVVEDKGAARLDPVLDEDYWAGDWA